MMTDYIMPKYKISQNAPQFYGVTFSSTFFIRHATH